MKTLLITVLTIAFLIAGMNAAKESVIEVRTIDRAAQIEEVLNR